MTSQLADQRDGDARSRRPFDHRQVFLSHSHSDRRLSDALQALVTSVYSGLVEVFTTADASPSGGLQPGDEWYARVHAELAKSESVWVLATKTSVTRPWLYWEAGLGRAICPGGVVVLRVGLSVSEIPPPLSALQSYDGLDDGPNGVSTMLTKIADGVGMTIDIETIAGPIRRWLTYAREHEPDVATNDGQPMLAPEQVDRVEQAIAKLERMAHRPLRTTIGARSEWMDTWVGKIFLLPDLDRVVASAPRSVVFEFAGFDSDGDARLTAIAHGRASEAYLDDGEVTGESVLSDLHPRARRLVAQIREAVRAREEESRIALDDLPF